MNINFKVYKYEKNNESFVKNGYDEYKITFLKGLKTTQLRIVVNSFLTKQVINLLSPGEGYKNKILLSIKEFITESPNPKKCVTGGFKLEAAKQFYSKQIINNITRYLLTINKEDSRDKLTEYGLINNEENMKTISQQLNIKSFPFEIKDKNGNIIYCEDNDGFWFKKEYDEKNNLLYTESSKGYWGKYTYDENGNEIYYEENDGYWVKKEYDKNGVEVYIENSDGYIRDDRPKFNKTNFFGVYSLDGELKSVHYTEEGAEENKLKCEKRYNEGFYVDYVVIHK